MTLKPTKTLLDHVEAEEKILLSLWNQFATLKAFEQELVKRIGSRKFIIANTVVWDAMIAKRDLLTIRFASWVRGMVEPGGFLRQVRSHHINDLRNAWNARAPLHEELAVLHTTHRRSRLEKLFPTAVARNQIDPVDVDALKDATWDKLRPVVQDRDSFRAHPYDGEAKADARMLGLNEIEPMLVHAQELMNTFRLVANNSTFGYHVTIPTDLGTAMQDLVDLLLFHGLLQLMSWTDANRQLHTATGQYWWQLRDAFLAELTRLGTEQPGLAVNDRALVKAAAKAVSH